MKIKKVRQVKHRTKKFFAYPYEKWAKSQGQKICTRSYGFRDYRTKYELINDAERNHDTLDID